MSVPAKTMRPPTGMEYEVGLLFAMLEETRRRTRDVVLGMSTADLDYRVPESPHSIAAHVLHIAGVEYWWVCRMVRNEPIPAGIEREYAPARLDSEEARTLAGRDAGYYLGKLDEVRALTEAACWELRGEDLDVVRKSPVDQTRCSVRWILGHLCDHEAHHRGQVQLLRRLARRTAP